MEPIATYRERLLQVSRRFSLFPDRVEVDARWLWRGRFTTTVQLSGLDPQFQAFYIRNKFFKLSLFLLIAGMAVVFLAGDAEQLRAMAPLPVIGVVVTFLGVALGWVTARRIPFARFRSRVGRAGLDIGCSGPDKAHFDSFLDQIQRQIRVVTKQANRQANRNSR